MDFFRKLALALFAAAGFSHGQWVVNQMTATTVKPGTNWGGVRMLLDSLDLEVNVSDGLVRTRATMVWTPETLKTMDWRSVNTCPNADSVDLQKGCYFQIVYDSLQTVVADSLEGHAFLQLPLDAAVTGMWFWMGGQKQASYVMDRWQASQQYSQIVGVRRDPALLETWGNGSYNLSLFPLKSGESRKLQIEIVQPQREGLQLPIAVRWNPYNYDYSLGRYVIDSLRPKSVRFSVQSDAPTNTVFDLGGLGKIPVGSVATVQSWSSPDSFVATISGRQPEVWTAVRDGKGAFGAAMAFKGSELQFDPEPTVRVVVLDADTSLERCRKLALLSLMKYGTGSYKVNLAWHDGKSLRHLWSQPVTFDAIHGLEALQFLKSWTPKRKADAISLLHEVAKSDTGAVVVLVSTSPYPIFTLNYVAYPTNWSDSAQVQPYRTFSDSSNRFYDQRNRDWKSVGQEMSGARQTLFGWWNDWYISDAAVLTGGYDFGSVTYPWYWWWVQNQAITAPALYGRSRFGYSESPSNLKLAIEGVQSDSVASLFQPNWGYCYWGWPIMIRRTTGSLILLDRKATFAARSTDAIDLKIVNDSIPVIFAARYAVGGSAKIKLSGSWGGLNFHASRSVSVPNPSGTEWGSRVWAGEYANMIQPWIWSDTSSEAAARAIGKGYGIVTPATSFLALEPGMKPLDSLAGLATGTSDIKTAGSLALNSSWTSTSDTVSGNPSSEAIDSTSLDDLFAGRIVSIHPKAAIPLSVGLKILSGTVVNLEVTGHDQGSASVRILDLKGREVDRLSMVRSGDRLTASWAPKGRGVFFAVAEGSLWKHTSSFTVGR